MLSPFLFILQTMNGFRKKFVPAIIWATIVFVLSTLPGMVFPKVGVSNADKAVHFTMYFIFVVCLLWSMYFNEWKNAAIKAFLIAALFGFSMEIIQLLTNSYLHRYFEWWDVAANSFGALMAAIIVELFLKGKFIFKVKK